MQETLHWLNIAQHTACKIIKLTIAFLVHTELTSGKI